MVWAPSIYKFSSIAGKLLMINRFMLTSFVGIGLVNKMIAIFIGNKRLLIEIRNSAKCLIVSCKHIKCKPTYCKHAWLINTLSYVLLKERYKWHLNSQSFISCVVWLPNRHVTTGEHVRWVTMYRIWHKITFAPPVKLLTHTEVISVFLVGWYRYEPEPCQQSYCPVQPLTQSSAALLGVIHLPELLFALECLKDSWAKQAGWLRPLLRPPGRLFYPDTL